MVNMRKKYNAKFRAKVALEAVKGEKTLAELSSEFGVQANQIGRLRKQLLETLPELFTGRRKKKDKDNEERNGNFKFTMELDLSGLEPFLIKAINGDEL